MAITLQRFTNSDTNYIPKHNQNAQTIESSINSLESAIAGIGGVAISVGQALQAMFGSLAAVIGAESYVPTEDGTDLNVAGGFFWRPSNATVVQTIGTTVLPFAGVSAGTYYVQVDITGAVSRSTVSTEATYSVAWTGSAFGAITRVCQIVWGAEEWIDAQSSTARGENYDSLAERFEAGEQEVVDARGAFSSLDARLDDIEGGISGGDVSGPASSTNNAVVLFDGTTGKVIKDSATTIDTDTALAANSDTRLATQKAVKAYVDALMAANDAMVFKGVIDCSGNPNYPAADAGHVYKVSVAGKIGGASGVNVEVGDSLYCVVDGSSAGTQAAVGANWVPVQVNLDGAVIGPASSVDSRVAMFDGATGKLLKDSGLTLSGTNTGDETTTTLGSKIDAAADKATPVDADLLGLVDSAASNVLKKLTWANLKATVKTYFDTLYAPLSQPFDMHLMMAKTQTDASQVIYRGKLARAVNFPGDFAGSQFTGSANATGSTVFDVQKNGSSVGSVTIAAGTVTATFATSGGSAVAFAAGDIFALIGPSTADTTLANAAFTFTGTR